MAAVLVVGVVEEGTLHGASREVASLALTLASAMRLPVVGTLVGSQTQEALDPFAALGLAEILNVGADGPPTPDLQVARLEAAVSACAASVVVAPHTLDTAEWLPLLAAREEAAVLTDCRDVRYVGGRLTATKMICGGAIGAEYSVQRAKCALTITPGIYPAAVSTGRSPIRNVEVAPPAQRVSFVEELTGYVASGPSLKQASIIVSGGLGIGKREQWHLVSDTARILSAAVGATRAVVESGWVPYSQQVGYSGVKVAPHLYIAIGISGAIHHLVGIAQAKTVVAINKDPNAEIFKVARFGIVGDAATVVPAFAERLKELRGG
jgi:electron transfer flavoprotein alpha subunit